jgi:hypothetical protein
MRKGNKMVKRISKNRKEINTNWKMDGVINLLYHFDDKIIKKDIKR